MKKVYYEELEEGSVHLGGECIVDKDEMLEYNRKNDPWPFHVDEEAAAQSSFGGLIASGTPSITVQKHLGLFWEVLIGTCGSICQFARATDYELK
jgi:hypothetical protein